MKTLFLFILFSFQSLAQSEAVFISTSYYEGLGERFRVEVASSWPKCQESKKARKLYLDKTNELREIALWRANGIMEEAGRTNLFKLIDEVNAVFAGASNAENPCLQKTQLGTEGAKASAQ
jgi:hypothetical protein